MSLKTENQRLDMNLIKDFILSSSEIIQLILCCTVFEPESCSTLNRIKNHRLSLSHMPSPHILTTCWDELSSVSILSTQLWFYVSWPLCKLWVAVCSWLWAASGVLALCLVARLALLFLCGSGPPIPPL